MKKSTLIILAFLTIVTFFSIGKSVGRREESDVRPIVVEVPDTTVRNVASSGMTNVAEEDYEGIKTTSEKTGVTINVANNNSVGQCNYVVSGLDGKYDVIIVPSPEIYSSDEDSQYGGINFSGDVEIIFTIVEIETGNVVGEQVVGATEYIKA